MSFHSLAKHKSIPFIDHIKIDISGNTTYNSGVNAYKWLDLSSVQISDNQDYNTESFKNYQLQKTSPDNVNDSDIENILGKLEPFDIRIYGVNFAENYPIINDRALKFEQIFFLTPRVPPAPRFQSETSSDSGHTLTLIYDVSSTEVGREDSSAKIISVITDYSQNDTFSSNIYPLDGTELNDSPETENANKEENFTIELNNLRTGTRYNYRVKAKII